MPLTTTKDHIAVEAEQRLPDQVCEPATSSNAKGVSVDFEGLEVSPKVRKNRLYLKQNIL